ncbi:hypothetical protein A3K86_21935 [Photobacterium jeanii]|uniref:Uncharacterized protein n=1 Tax=Photobacterium jeanii TaxID=858640 RepID=A0A178K4D7_9GAMM|nr:hypothetical protein [Photobacterium jeanii]OAN11582.1 hypothetical protein A3K86_21935 [Photobacterium jeanii]PST91104.1 hypothetical protein C9I91_11040 [Photobacterium jeanii]
MIPPIANSGSMPINAGGGHAGPSNAEANNKSGFNIGGINMGGGSLNSWLPVLLAIAVVWFLIKKVG